MTYTKSLIVAVALTLAWIMGDPAVATGPQPAPQLTEQALDPGTLESLATTYMSNGAYDAAIGPLARAVQLAPARRSLWAKLDEAIKKSGRGSITDEELTRRAAAFQGR